MPGPPPMPPPPSEPRKSSGCRNGHHAPFQESGRCSERASRLPDGPRSPRARCSTVSGPSAGSACERLASDRAMGRGRRSPPPRSAAAPPYRDRRRAEIGGGRRLMVHAPAIVHGVVERYLMTLAAGIGAVAAVQRSAEIDPVEAEDDVGARAAQRALPRRRKHATARRHAACGRSGSWRRFSGPLMTRAPAASASFTRASQRPRLREARPTSITDFLRGRSRAAAFASGLGRGRANGRRREARGIQRGGGSASFASCISASRLT